MVVTLDNFHTDGTFPDEKEELKRAVSLVQSGAEQERPDKTLIAFDKGLFLPSDR